MLYSVIFRFNLFAAINIQPASLGQPLLVSSSIKCVIALWPYIKTPVLLRIFICLWRDWHHLYGIKLVHSNVNVYISHIFYFMIYLYISYPHVYACVGPILLYIARLVRVGSDRRAKWDACLYQSAQEVSVECWADGRRG